MPGKRKEKEIPDALAFMMDGDDDVTILEMGDDFLRVEKSRKMRGVCTFVVFLYRFETAGFETFTLEGCKQIKCIETAYSFIYKYQIGTFRRGSKNEFCDLVEDLKYASLGKNKQPIDAAKAHVLTGDPVLNLASMMEMQSEPELSYCQDFGEQLREWFVRRPLEGGEEGFSRIASDVDLAVCISSHKSYHRYAYRGIGTSFREELGSLHLNGHGLFSRGLSRIYIGNEFCPLLWPRENDLYALLERAAVEAMDVTVVFSYLTNEILDSTFEKLRRLHGWCAERNVGIEVVFNDWGMLEYLATNRFDHFRLNLGRLLNKRFKDPRAHKPELLEGLRAKLRQNSLNCHHFTAFLDRVGVERYEFESHGIGNVVPTGRHSLHVPYYQMNTGKYCMLHAICRTGNRNIQEHVSHCPYYCERFAVLYPRALNTIQKGNTIFGFDAQVLSDQEILRSYVDKGIDRIVFTPL